MAPSVLPADVIARRSICRHAIADIGIDEDLHSPVNGTVQLGHYE